MHSPCCSRKSIRKKELVFHLLLVGVEVQLLVVHLLSHGHILFLAVIHRLDALIHCLAHMSQICAFL